MILDEDHTTFYSRIFECIYMRVFFFSFIEHTFICTLLLGGLNRFAFIIYKTKCCKNLLNDCFASSYLWLLQTVFTPLQQRETDLNERAIFNTARCCQINVFKASLHVHYILLSSWLASSAGSFAFMSVPSRCNSVCVRL